MDKKKNIGKGRGWLKKKGTTLRRRVLYKRGGGGSLYEAALLTVKTTKQKLRESSIIFNVKMKSN